MLSKIVNKIKSMAIKFDCFDFNGYKPCDRNFLNNLDFCKNCKDYRQIKRHILIIQTGAMGDVLRSTAILRRLKTSFTKIYWATKYPEILEDAKNEKFLDVIFDINDLRNVFVILSYTFDIVYNFDKDVFSCALCKQVNAKKKIGYVIDDNVVKQVPSYTTQYYRGISQKYARENKKSYLQEIFEMCGFVYNNEDYIISYPQNIKQNNVITIGIKVGTGKMWKNREMSVQKIVNLINDIKNKMTCDVVLLGSHEDEDKINSILYNFGSDSVMKKISSTYKEFVYNIASCDIIITPVTLCMHISLGLKKPTIILNNIFFPNEFDLFDVGYLINVDRPCFGCYNRFCNTVNCLDSIPNDKIIEILLKEVRKYEIYKT